VHRTPNTLIDFKCVEEKKWKREKSVKIARANGNQRKEFETDGTTLKWSNLCSQMDQRPRIYINKSEEKIPIGWVE
jgi:hypothetical protein